MVKKSNVNLYDASGGSRFNINVTDNAVTVSSVQPLKFPDMSIGSVNSVVGALVQVQADIQTEKTNREAKQMECMKECSIATTDAVAAEKKERIDAVQAVNDKVYAILDASPERANSLKELLNLMDSEDNGIKGLSTTLTNRVASLEAKLVSVETTVDELTSAQ